MKQCCTKREWQSVGAGPGALLLAGSTVAKNIVLPSKNSGRARDRVPRSPLRGLPDGGGLRRGAVSTDGGGGSIAASADVNPEQTVNLAVGVADLIPTFALRTPGQYSDDDPNVPMIFTAEWIGT